MVGYVPALHNANTWSFLYFHQPFCWWQASANGSELASELVLSTCPKRVLSKLPALTTTADEHTDRRTLGSDAMSFACASKNLEIKRSSICGESSASAGAILSLLCHLLQSNVTKIGDFLRRDILEGHI